MKTIYHLISYIAFMSTGLLCAQPINWSPVSVPDPPYNPRGLYYSSNLDMTIYCGLFFENPGHYYVAAFNGDSWELLLDSMQIAIQCAADYQNGVLVGGSQTSPGPEIHAIGFYDGEEWSYPWNFSGGNIENLVWTNDTLFALGHFTHVDGEPIYKIAKLVNGTWQAVISPPNVPISLSHFRDIEYYDGAYYVGGNFELENGLKDLGRIENLELTQVGAGILGFATNIMDLQVYQDALLIAGHILFVEGNASNYIVRWNGAEYLDMGDQLRFNQGVDDGWGNVKKLFVKNNYLYCTGSFHFIGDTPLSSVARWDGQQWCGLWGYSFNDELLNTPLFSDFFENQLMILQPYTYEDGSIDYFWLFEGGDEVEFCNDPVLTQINTEILTFSVFPNPARENCTVDAGNEIILDLMLFNAQGQILQRFSPQTSRIDLDMDWLRAGMYLIKVNTTKGMGVEKLVVE